MKLSLRNKIKENHVLKRENRAWAWAKRRKTKQKDQQQRVNVLLYVNLLTTSLLDQILRGYLHAYQPLKRRVMAVASVDVQQVRER